MTSQQPAEVRSASPLDTLLLLAALLLPVAGVAGFYLLAADLNLTVRVALVLASLGAAAALAYQTQTGKTVWGFIRGASIEFRKTTWPTRQESLQSTLMIAVVVLFTALLLWGLDSLLLWGVKSVTGQG